jgi:HD-GYP domain-containing protein (c-di-GMP phosphodiesterase class II)
VNLSPFSKQYLRMGEALPFPLRDGGGRLLLAANVRMDDPKTFAGLQAAELFADDHESNEWRRRLGSAMDTAMRQNATLQKIADIRPPAERERSAGPAKGLGEQWGDLTTVLDVALRDLRADTPWMSRLLAVHERASRLAEQRLDASLYHLIYTAGNGTERYSSSHGLLCLVVVIEAASKLGWDAPLVNSLSMAALTMNSSMRRLQDQLAASDLPVSAASRAAIDEHAEQSALMLREAGVADPVWIEIVRLHHDDSLKGQPLDELTPAQRAARLLRRVDIFTAKLSRRATRGPMSPVQAAREACLGPSGTPDEIGGALLKAVGLYPPGSFVELVNGEICIVVARGPRANLPVVVVLIGADGAHRGNAAQRDTHDRRYAVKGAVSAATVRVTPPHEALMARR